MQKPNCPDCGAGFDSWAKLRHHHTTEHGEPLPNKECETCGKWFYSEYAKYCSDKCREEGVSQQGHNNPNYRGGKESTECEICGTEFEYYPSEKEGLYCPECVKSKNWRHNPDITGPDNPRWSGGKLELKCVVCGTTSENLGRNPDVHHIVPVRLFDRATDWTKADAHDLNNVVSLCPACHRSAEFGKISKEQLWTAIDAPEDSRLFAP